MTTREATKRLKYSQSHIEELCRKGMLKARKIKGIWEITEEDIQEFTRTHKRRRITVPYPYSE